MRLQNRTPDLFRARLRGLLRLDEEFAREVTLCRRRREGHDRLAGEVVALGHFECGSHVRAGRDAAGNASSLATAREVSKAFSLETRTTSSMSLVSSTPGTKPAPMPWILCGPRAPPERTGLPSGSTAMILIAGFLPSRRGRRPSVCRRCRRRRRVHRSCGRVVPDLLGGRLLMHERVRRVFELVG